MSGPDSPRWPGRIPPGRRWTRWTARAAVGKLADLYATKLGDFAEIITGEMGSPITFSQLAQAPQPQMMLSYFADLGKSFTWEDERPGLFGPVTVHREPVGVVAAIVPWNVPQFTIIWYVAPTVFADVDPGMRIAREEIFGPVLAVIPTRTSRTRSRSPTTATTAWPAPSGPPTSSTACRSPAASAPAPTA
jgi:acyl-CoA reductase-like NAD-dependent aldehyde dehydrogenase